MLGALIGGALGGLFGMKGQQDANKTNVEIANKQMDFQKEMSNTAHQRQISDLKSAGLNPLLSATGGASSPPGAGTQVQNEAGAGIASAQQAAAIGLAIKKQKEEVSVLKSQASKNSAETKNIQARTPKEQTQSALWQMLLEPAQTGTRAIKKAWKNTDSTKPKKDHLLNLIKQNRRKP